MKKKDKSEVDPLITLQNYIDNQQYLLAYRNIMIYLKMTEQLKVKNINIIIFYRIIILNISADYYMKKLVFII